MNIDWLGIAGFGVVLLTSAVMGAFVILRRRKPATFRDIPAVERLRKAVSRVVEDGSRLHVSLGRAALYTQQSSSALAGLTVLRRLADLTSAGDQSPIATSGDASLAIVSQDMLQSGSQATARGRYDPTAGRLTGLTPFSYAAGALPAMRDENVSADVLIGNFGVEVALLTDAAQRKDTFSLAGSDNLAAQAVLYASAQEPLIGEEVYATGAYIGAGRLHQASLLTQDILRWLLILGILAGTLLKLAGIL